MSSAQSRRRVQPVRCSWLTAGAARARAPQVYDAQKGAFTELGMLDVQQIFGRAGRPQVRGALWCPLQRACRGPWCCVAGRSCRAWLAWCSCCRLAPAAGCEPCSSACVFAQKEKTWPALSRHGAAAPAPRPTVRHERRGHHHHLPRQAGALPGHAHVAAAHRVTGACTTVVSRAQGVPHAVGPPQARTRCPCAAAAFFALLLIL